MDEDVPPPEDAPVVAEDDVSPEDADDPVPLLRELEPPEATVDVPLLTLEDADAPEDVPDPVGVDDANDVAAEVPEDTAPELPDDVAALDAVTTTPEDAPAPTSWVHRRFRHSPPAQSALLLQPGAHTPSAAHPYPAAQSALERH